MSRVRSRDLVIASLGPTRALVHVPSRSITAELPPSLAQALLRLTAFKSIDDHAHDLCAAFGRPPGGPEALARALADCAGRGLLVEDTELRTAIASTSHAEESRITAIGVVTRNRPESLQRCVDSFVANARAHGRPVRLVVTDDSDDPAVVDANARVLAQIRTRHGIAVWHATAHDKHAFVDALAREAAVAPATVELALFDVEGLGGSSCGANRNALCLATAGELVLCVDDDVVCRPIAPHDPVSHARVTSAYDPTHVRVHEDRDAIVARHAAVEWDVIGAHARLLGRPVGAITDRELAFDAISPALLARLSAGTARTRIVQPGLYGDSGATYASYHLWRPDVRAHLGFEVDAAGYARTRTSREIVRAAPALTVGDGGYFQSFAFALDLRAPLSPFMPVDRGSDLVFGRVVASALRGSLIAYLPQALLHAAWRGRALAPDDVFGAARTLTLYQLVLAAIDLWTPPVCNVDDATALAMLGQHLVALGRSRASDFATALRGALWSMFGREVTDLSRKLEQTPRPTTGWQDDLARYLEIRRAALTDPQFSIVPDSLRGRGDEEALVRRLIGRFGELLVAWPALVSAASRLRERGVSLAREVA
ncbi:MAG TPA: hypothetical protein VFQ53_33415 [Kofleriaceae bacterium]|nr:hypothetical protein [Kofleriaceae bacterium]